MKSYFKHNSRIHNIRTWRKFSKRVRKNTSDLLLKLDEFDNAVLITGCQRSGTTALTKVITNSEQMVNYSFGNDDELDAALILSGELKHNVQGRYCFQTTYLNERYVDYYKHTENSFKIIWVIRNPFSVVYSMLHNWGRFAFNELFLSCGHQYLTELEKKRFHIFGKLSISRVKQACMSYKGKYKQLFDLNQNLEKSKILIVDYDYLINEKINALHTIYRFIDLTYKQNYGDKLHSQSIDKAKRLSSKEYSIIENYCGPIYRKAKVLVK